LVDLFEYMMMHGLTNPKCIWYVFCVVLCTDSELFFLEKVLIDYLL